MTTSQQLARARMCFQLWEKAQSPAPLSPDTDTRPDADAGPKADSGPETAVESGIEEQEEEAWCESVIIRDGFYVGRRFQTPTATCIWFAEEDQLKIRGRDGEALQTFDAMQMSEMLHEHQNQTAPLRKAA